jgi:hypothetical protein
MTIRIQGEAGAGKTWLTNKLKENFPKIRTGSTTWVSGLLINSPTYYRKLQLKVDFEREPIKIPLSKRKKYHTVIIDEASMLSKIKLDWLQKSYPTYTFILVGDWNQLPPVNEEPISDNQIDLEIQLTGQYRQTDINYYSFIQRYLDNKLTGFDRQQIKSRTITREEAISSNDMILCFHNSYYDEEGKRTPDGRLDYIEKRMGNSMTSKHTPNTRLISKVYYESDTGKRIFPTRHDWFNNEIFTVKERYDNYIVLKNERTEFPVTYEELKFFDRADSLTIHKIQGQTIEGNIIVDLDSIWKAEKDIVPRLIYVAVSRVRSWEKIRFIGNLNSPFMDRVSLKNPLILDNNKLLNEVLLLSRKNRILKNNLVVLAGNNIVMCMAKTTKEKPGFKQRITQNEFLFLTGTSKQNLRHYDSIAEAWEKFLIKLGEASEDTTADNSKPTRTIVITDEYMGTPMKQFDSGAAIVDDTPSKTTEFVTINKLVDGSKTAKDENIETYSSFIFEIDNEDIESQKRRAKKLFNDKIVNRVVYSGGKSIHCRITLENPPDNKDEYKYIWKKLNETYFDNKADTACSNPARLTRMPNAIRKNGIKQKRLFLSNERLNFDWKEGYETDKMVEEWLSQRNGDRPRPSGISPLGELLKRNIPMEARKLLENNFVDGEKHKMIPKAISFLMFCGYDLNYIDSLVKATKIKDSKNYVKNIYNYFKGA